MPTINQGISAFGAAGVPLDPARSGDFGGAELNTLGRAKRRFGDVLRNSLDRDAEGSAGASRHFPSPLDAPMTERSGSRLDTYDEPPTDGFARISTRGLYPVEMVGDAGASGDITRSVGDAVRGRLDRTRESREESESALQTLMSGGDIELHNVLFAQQKSMMELRMTMQFRNKLIEAYQEVMRMPV